MYFDRSSVVNANSINPIDDYSEMDEEIHIQKQLCVKIPITLMSLGNVLDAWLGPVRMVW